MKKLSLWASVLTSLYFICGITYHYFYPGEHYVYTKALLLSAILMPVFSALLLMLPDIHVALRKNGQERKNMLFGVPFALALAGVFAGIILGLQGFFWLALYFYPVVMHFLAGTHVQAKDEAISFVLSYFGAFTLALGIAILLGELPAFMVQAEHFDHIWPEYSDGAMLMLAVTLFAVINQMRYLRLSLKAVRHA